jgi:hypothetical protein
VYVYKKDCGVKTHRAVSADIIKKLTLSTQIKMAPRGNLNPLEPSHEVVLENHFHKFPRRARQAVIDLKTMN